jgi:hypothetical protein
MRLTVQQTSTKRKNKRDLESPSCTETQKELKTALENCMHYNDINTCYLQETNLQGGNPFKNRRYQTFKNDRKGRKRGM